MAKFENEGYCPCIWVPKKWDENTDTRLAGLWSVVGASIVYAQEDNPNTDCCDQIFSTDAIAYDVLFGIVKKNANADKIMVKQPHYMSCNRQSLTDVQKILGEATNPELIAHAGSNFVVILADAPYGMDVWVWDLRAVF